MKEVVAGLVAWRARIEPRVDELIALNLERRLLLIESSIEKVVASAAKLEVAMEIAQDSFKKASHDIRESAHQLVNVAATVLQATKVTNEKLERLVVQKEQEIPR